MRPPECSLSRPKPRILMICRFVGGVVLSIDGLFLLVATDGKNRRLGQDEE